MPWDFKKQCSTSSSPRRLSSIKFRPTLRGMPIELMPQWALLYSSAEGAVMLWWVLRRHSRQIRQGVRALVPRCNVRRITEHCTHNEHWQNGPMTAPNANDERGPRLDMTSGVCIHGFARRDKSSLWHDQGIRGSHPEALDVASWHPRHTTYADVLFFSSLSMKGPLELWNYGTMGELHSSHYCATATLPNPIPHHCSHRRTNDFAQQRLPH